MVSKQFLKYLETAKQMEKDGLSFYKKALKRVADPNSKGLLQFLVKEEGEHLAYFTGLAKEKADGSKVKALKTPLFKKAAYKKIGKKRAITIEVFTTALEMEEKGIAYYSKMAAKTDDKETKKLLLKIAEMEKKHFRLIKMHQDAVYDAWYWEAMEMPALNT